MITVFGIRHHGPGSARSLKQALELADPDCILVEGPPEADDVLPLAAHAEMKPPIALLVHDSEVPQRAVYYPMAEFSPEWQAIQFGLSRKVELRFIDLPQAIQMGIAVEREAVPADPAEEPEVERDADAEEKPLFVDPLAYLASAAGYSDSELWWEHMVEHRREGKEIFSAVLEAITALREAAIPSQLQLLRADREAQREAHMRQMIRAAEKDGFQRIAVVCGAWHAPALVNMPAAKADSALVKGLPKRKVTATWIPWTYNRLTFASGYGAGITSPGWYDFLWKLEGAQRNAVATRWLTGVARLLRQEDLDASSASVIEAVRLAESLSALRGRPLPGLTELNDATQSVLCFGDALPLRLILDKLIVSDRLGQVPSETPMVPLAQDLAREQKRLRLQPEAAHKQLDLDLRKPLELDRSRLLHRLNLLGISWGRHEQQRMRQKGTFHEFWTLQWMPEFAVSLIEAGVWGNTITGAAVARARHDADAIPELPALTTLLDATLLADLPEAVEHLIGRIQDVAAVASDVAHLMAALPPLAGIMRYGNVRQTDATMVSGVVEGLVTRIAIGLPVACASLNDEAAEEMFHRMVECHGAIGLLQNKEHSAVWTATLRQLADAPNLHGRIGGRACRLLLETRELDVEDAARRLGLALSFANPPEQSAAWIDGFLRESGLLLLHDDTLWNVLDNWVTALSAEHFITALPLLRRTFSTFQAGERRQLGSRVGGSGGARKVSVALTAENFDHERADRALPLIAQLLGLKMSGREPEQ